ncbi:MAG: Tm-1-like ATP-binding domain-containing protein [Pirellulales bacterium]
MPAVYLLATLDTKGPDAAFVCERLRDLGIPVVVVDTGVIGPPTSASDIARDAVFEAAGTRLADVISRGDRGAAIEAAARGAARIVAEAWKRGDLVGVLGLGGSAGTTIGAAAMRVLPLGVPKLMVSTLASGQVRPFVGDKDILMLNAVVDIAGVNRISRAIYGQAAAAMAGMVRFALPGGESPSKPLIAATMFGVTTPCVLRAKEVLEAAGYEVLVFHATGNGGQTLESLAQEGLLAGVLDITTTELADELVGGILSAGPDRLTAAARHGIPQVVSVGALDMVNFGPRDSVPVRFAGRHFHVHNANVTLMRTTAAENAELGREIATKVAASLGPASILLPLRGVSAIDRQGGVFDDPAAREALFQSIRTHRGSSELIELDCHINDPLFAETAANRLLKMLAERRQT